MQQWRHTAGGGNDVLPLLERPCSNKIYEFQSKLYDSFMFVITCVNDKRVVFIHETKKSDVQ